MKNEMKQRSQIDFKRPIFKITKKNSSFFLSHLTDRIRRYTIALQRVSESHNVLLGPKGLFSFAINWLFDALERSHSKFVVRSTAAQFDSEQLIDLFAKHSKLFTM